MRAHLIVGLSAVLLLAGWQMAAADQTDYQALSLAAPELSLDLGPRAVGRGGAITAEAQGTDALNWNPAGLAKSVYQIDAMHAIYLQDSLLETLAYAQPLWEGGGAGLQAVYVNYGKMEQTELVDGVPTAVGEFNPGTLVVSLGVGQKILPTLAVGVAGKYYRYEMMGNLYTTWAGDAGVQWSLLDDTVMLGFAARNIGQAVAGYSLPLTYKAGASYRLPWTAMEGDRWSVEADADLTRSVSRPAVRVGTAYQFKVAAVRAGYIFREDENLGSPAGLTLGAGLRGPLVSLDYAVAFYGVLGVVHHLGASASF